MSREEPEPPLGSSQQQQELPAGQEYLAPATAVQTLAKRSTTRRSLPSAILFEEQDGLFWLRGQHLDRARSPLGLRCESPSVGFDRLTWSAYVANLASKRIPIGVARGSTISTVRLRAISKTSQLHSVALDLTPDRLVRQQEIERLASCLTRKHWRVGGLVRHIRAESSERRPKRVDRSRSPLRLPRYRRQLRVGLGLNAIAPNRGIRGRGFGSKLCAGRLVAHLVTNKWNAN